MQVARIAKLYLYKHKTEWTVISSVRNAITIYISLSETEL